jgi:hypothetical protein
VALKSYLEGAKDVPTVVEPKAEPGDTQGLVTSSIQDGELFLRSKAGDVYRLEWKSKETSPPGRALPAGEYVLQGYRIANGDWLISSTGGRKNVVVEPGVTTAIDVDPKIGVKVRAFPVRGKVSVQLGVTGHDRRGLSVYRKGKRVKLTFTLKTRSGAKLTSGALEYG